MRLENAELTISIRDDAVHIEIEDGDAAVTFVEVAVSPEKFVAALGRLGHVPVISCEVRALDKIGTKMEVDKLEFQMPKSNAFELGDAKRLTARMLSLKSCPKGWTPDQSFSSRTSFFYKGGNEYARCTIRRWVDREEAT